MDGKIDLTGKTLVLRADAFTGLGTGHLMRAIALGEAWKEISGGKVVAITYCEPPALMDRLKNEGFEVYPLNQPFPARQCENALEAVASREDLSGGNQPWLLLDGVHFDESYHGYIKGFGYRLAVVDDMAKLPFYDCDLVINQNLHAFGLHYEASAGTRLLLGTGYVMLRREFRKHLAGFGGIDRTTADRAKNVLITLGGIDLKNNTEKILLALKKIENFDFTVIAGPGYPYLKHLNYMRMASPMKILHSVSDMAGVMNQTDIAISSGGTTVWELAFMGVPSIIGRVAPIEDPLVNGLKAHGLFVDSGWFETVPKDEILANFMALAEDKPGREEMSKKARATVTGEGCLKVISQMRNL